MWLTKTTVKGFFYASLIRIDGSIEISDGNFAKSIYMDRLSARHFKMSGSSVGTPERRQIRQLSLLAATPGTIAISRLAFTKLSFQETRASAPTTLRT